MKSLAEFLGTAPEIVEDPTPRLEDITDSHEFAMAVLSSSEFRRYIVGSLLLGTLPAAVITRLMDYAWGKPVDRVEHSGRVETITEVRRVVIHVEEKPRELDEKEQDPSYTMH